ncbi:MAG: hypothetical protein R3F35_01645 [Myxococcota bacterium]
MILDELTQVLGFEVRDSGLRRFQSNLVGTVGKMAALAAGATVVVGAIRSVLDAASETAGVSRFARSIDLSYQSLQRLEFAAADVGVSVDSLRGALANLRQTSLALYSGLGDSGALAAFAHLGIDIRNARGELKGADQLFLEIARGVGRSSNPELAKTLAEQIGLGTELNLLLRLGSDGINSLGDEAERLGIVLGKDAATASERFESRLSRLKRTGSALLVDVGLPLVEWVTGLVEGFQRFQKSKEGRVALDLMRSTVSGLLEVLKLFAEPFKAFFALWERFGPVAVAALAPLWPLIRPILKIVNPFAKAKLAVLGLLAALQDLRVFITKSGRSLIGDVLNDLGIGEDVARGRAARFLEDFRDRFRRAPGAAADLWDGLINSAPVGFLSGFAGGALSFPGAALSGNLPQALFPGLGRGPAPAAAGATTVNANANIYVSGSGDAGAVAERIRRQFQSIVREAMEETPKGRNR